MSPIAFEQHPLFEGGGPVVLLCEHMVPIGRRDDDEIAGTEFCDKCIEIWEGSHGRV